MPRLSPEHEQELRELCAALDDRADAIRALAESPVRCSCHPGVQWTTETWGQMCPITRLEQQLAEVTRQRDESDAALVLAGPRIRRRGFRGPWGHAFGCPAEDDGPDNVPCTCGAWNEVEVIHSAVEAARARQSAAKETQNG